MSQNDTPTIFSRSTKVSDSSTVNQIDFDPATEVMMVTFNTGATYVYSPVSASFYGTIVAADSVGKMLNILIKENDDITYALVD